MLRRASVTRAPFWADFRALSIMLVVCGRCETEYEFDDTLLSERGTTVKCTNCGYQFRVKAPRGMRTGLERWEVRKASGARITLGSLRELRKAIEEDRVSVDDELSRQGGPFRPLRSVAELEALFQRKRPPQPRLNQTLMGVGNPGGSGELPATKPAVASMPVKVPMPSPQAAPARTPTYQPAPRQASAEPTARAPQRRETLAGPSPDLSRGAEQVDPNEVDPSEAETIPPAPRSSSPPQRAPRHSPPPPRRWTTTQQSAVGDDRRTPTGSSAVYESFSSEDRKSASFTSVPPPGPDAAAAKQSTHGGQQDASGLAPTVLSVEAEKPQVAAAQPSGEADAPADRRAIASSVKFASVPPSPGEAQRSPGPATPPGAPRSMPPAPLSVPPPPRRAGGLRWVVGFVLLGGVGLLAGTVGKDYLMQFVRPGVASVADERVEAMLASAGELYSAGELDAAKAEYDRASVLAENEPRIAFGLARLAAARADQEWLRLRLIASDADAVKARVERELERRKEQLAAAMAELDESDTSHRAALLETDAARIRGEVDAARQRVHDSAFDVTEPEVAYVLAMLDLTGDSPGWSTVIERLRTALVAEGGLGRARSALVFALASSGNAGEARRELEQLAESQQRHPLLEDLKVFVSNQVDEQLAAEEAEGTEPALGQQPAEPVEIDGDDSAADGPQGKSTASAEWFLHEAAAARRSGDLNGAKKRYARALQLKPGNISALSGLGAIARMQGNYQEAKKHYDSVLAQSPSNAQALAGGADARWLMGSREAAVQMYRKIPAGTVYSAVAQRRIAELSGTDAPKAAADEQGPGETADSKKTAPSSDSDDAKPGNSGAGSSGSEAADTQSSDSESSDSKAAPKPAPGKSEGDSLPGSDESKPEPKSSGPQAAPDTEPEVTPPKPNPASQKPAPSEAQP